MSDRHRCRSALLAGALAFLGAWLVAFALASAVARLSVDQPLQAEALLEWGGRWAWLLAVAMASGAALGARPAASWLQSLRCNLQILLLLLGSVLAAMALAIVLVRLGLWGQDWGLSARSGHGAGIAAESMAWWLGPPSAALGGWMLFRARCRSPHG